MLIYGEITKERCVNFFEKVRETLGFNPAPDVVSKEINSRKPRHLSISQERKFNEFLQKYISDLIKVYELRIQHNEQKNKFQEAQDEEQKSYLLHAEFKKRGDAALIHAAEGVKRVLEEFGIEVGVVSIAHTTRLPGTKSSYVAAGVTSGEEIIVSMLEKHAAFIPQLAEQIYAKLKQK